MVRTTGLGRHIPHACSSQPFHSRRTVLTDCSEPLPVSTNRIDQSHAVMLVALACPSLLVAPVLRRIRPCSIIALSLSVRQGHAPVSTFIRLRCRVFGVHSLHTNTDLFTRLDPSAESVEGIDACKHVSFHRLLLQFEGIVHGFQRGLLGGLEQHLGKADCLWHAQLPIVWKRTP